MRIGRVVANARRSAGLSVRELASRAQVAGSTITRIQSGAVDPSVHTLERILGAAGYELRIDVVRRGRSAPMLADLVDAWTRRGSQLQPSWNRWRGLLDQLALHPELTPEAVYATPPPSGEVVIDALLAAVAEKLADDAGLPRPAWTHDVAILEEPFRPSTARRGVDHAVPHQLAARGLMIDTTSLWRDPASVGA